MDVASSSALVVRLRFSLMIFTRALGYRSRYLRRLEKVNGKLTNVELEVFATAVKDPWKIINNKK